MSGGIDRRALHGEHRLQTTSLSRWNTFSIVVVLAPLTVAILRGAVVPAVFWGALLAASGASLVLNWTHPLGTVIDAEGLRVRRFWGSVRRVRWQDLDRVGVPGRWDVDAPPTAHLRDGGSLPLFGVPTEVASRLAAAVDAGAPPEPAGVDEPRPAVGDLGAGATARRKRLVIRWAGVALVCYVLSQLLPLAEDGLPEPVLTAAAIVLVLGMVGGFLGAGWAAVWVPRQEPTRPREHVIGRSVRRPRP